MAMADLSIFSVLASSFQSILVLVGCYHRPFFCEGICRGLVDNAEDQPPLSLFLVFIDVATDHFSGGISLICWLYFPCLLVNEEWAALHDHEALEICLLSWKSSPSAPRASRQERRENGASRGNHFSLSF